MTTTITAEDRARLRADIVSHRDNGPPGTDTHTMKISDLLALLDQLEAVNRKLAELTTCRMCSGSGIVGSAPDNYFDCPDCASEVGHMLLVSGKEPGLAIASNLPDGLYKLRAELESRPQSEVFEEWRAAAAIASQGEST